MISNIIDNRKLRYRWRRINAIAEPTWHDNSASDSDNAQPVEGESDYEEKRLTSMAEAIEWARAFPFPVTLHIYDEDDGKGTTLA